MQEHGNQKGKIILQPSLLGGLGEHPKDYFAEAERTINERRRQKAAEEESVMPSLRLPKPGELAHDISPEEKAREELEKRQQEQAEAQRKVLEDQGNIAAAQPTTIPATVILGTPPGYAIDTAGSSSLTNQT